MKDADKIKLKNEAQGQYLAIAYLLGANRAQYRKLIENLENDFLRQNNYPKTVTAAYNLLTNWKQDPHNVMQVLGPANDGVLFANADMEGQDDQGVALANNGKK